MSRAFLSLSSTSLLCILLASSLSVEAQEFIGKYPDSKYTPPWTVGQAVKTTSGTCLGQASKVRPSVSEYLGIPFARPPVGELRFAAPKPYRSDATLNTTQFAPDCPSNSFNLQNFLQSLSADASSKFFSSLNLPPSINLLKAYGQAGNTQGEDCLALNIWTKPQTRDAKKAVMIYIYGGGFESGATNNPFYNGAAFADDQDVVIVTINYRTNVFGFPGIPDFSAISQNAGLQDQRLAIEWVRDNIARFGGDPRRITLFGQSAGGASADIYAYAYTHDPIVNGFISQSGTATSFFDQSRRNNTASWFNASRSLGCGDESAGIKASISCMRTKPFEDILKAVVVDNPIKSVLGNFGPTVDEEIVFADYEARANEGSFIHKPLLVGTNDYEAGLFRLATYGSQNLPDVAWCLFNAFIFNCPASRAAKWRADSGVPAWRYRYFGDFFNLRLTTEPTSGAWHGSEIPMIFGTADLSSGVTSTEAQMQYARYMQGVWAAFAKDPEGGLAGDDNSPYHLRSYNSLIPAIIQFGRKNDTYENPSYSLPLNYDLACPAIQKLDESVPGGLVNYVTSGNANMQSLLQTLGGSDGGSSSLLSFLQRPGFRCPF